MRVLGIDPGSRVTGFGVVEERNGQARFVTCGTVRLDPGDAMAERLVELYDTLGRILRETRPDTAAIERVFVSRNADSALKLGHARGVTLLALRQAGLPVHEYTPAQVKKSVTGSGRAEKGQIGLLVRMLLELPDPPAEDAADALAIALCHTMLARGQARIDEALARGAR
jgi:crossover junction endodeoxyribonuclease RuvC